MNIADSISALWPARMHITENEVHVWSTCSDVEPADVDRLAKLLSDDERDRAGRFHFRKDRNRFIVGRGLLRTILSRYLNLDSDKLQFEYSSHGKPQLAPNYQAPGAPALRFSLTHSQELVLYAIAFREIGIDVEHIRKDFEVEPLAGQVFSRNELAKLLTLPSSLRREAFFRCWTRKEAYIKGRGEGLSVPLDQFEVSLLPDELPALLSVADNPDEPSRWCLKELPSSPAWLSALAVKKMPGDFEAPRTLLVSPPGFAT
jgi:4'-phosphopantetheinyl transferase